jgi:hypothetical protein
MSTWPIWKTLLRNRRWPERGPTVSAIDLSGFWRFLTRRDWVFTQARAMAIASRGGRGALPRSGGDLTPGEAKDPRWASKRSPARRRSHPQLALGPLLNASSGSFAPDRRGGTTKHIESSRLRRRLLLALSRAAGCEIRQLPGSWWNFRASPSLWRVGADPDRKDQPSSTASQTRAQIRMLVITAAEPMSLARRASS